MEFKKEVISICVIVVKKVLCRQKMQLVYEPNIFNEDDEKIYSSGLDVITCKFEIDGPKFSKELSGPFLFRGSIQLGRRVSKEHPESITWLYDNVYDCKSYLHYLGDLALNNPHMYVEAKFLNEWAERIDIDFFCKQNSGYKFVTGGLYSNVKYDIPLLYPEELVLISEARPVGAEWRCIISEQSLLSYAGYGDIIHPFPEDGEGFVKQVLEAIPEPAPMWVLDICRVAGELKVVEINALLTSGWYDCDRDKILSELKRQVSILGV